MNVLLETKLFSIKVSLFPMMNIFMMPTILWRLQIHQVCRLQQDRSYGNQ